MYKVKVEVRFRYGHRLLPPYKGHCNNVHGEGSVAIVEFENDKLDVNGMVLDFGEAKKKIKSWIDDNWDHAYIYNNDDEIGRYLFEKGFKTFNLWNNPTAENMAWFLYNVIRTGISGKVKRVGIVESFEDSIAYYEESLSDEKISVEEIDIKTDLVCENCDRFVKYLNKDKLCKECDLQLNKGEGK